MAGHRYWAARDLFSGQGYVSMGEGWFQASGSDLTPTSSLGSSALDGGSVVTLAWDGTDATRWMTDGSQDGSSWIAYDYGADVLPDAFRLSAPTGDPASRTASTGAVYYSDTGLTGPWTPYAPLFWEAGWSSGSQQISAFVPPPAVSGGYRYWRIRNFGGGGFVSAAEVVFQLGGVDQPPPAVSSCSQGPYNNSCRQCYAYDNNSATFWMTAGGTCDFEYDYGGPAVFDGIRIQASTGDLPSRTPTSGDVECSLDGTTWVAVGSVSFGGWSDGQSQTDTFPLPPASLVAVAAQSAFAVLTSVGESIAAQSAFTVMTQKTIDIAAQSAFIVYIKPPQPPPVRRRQYYLQ